MNTVIVVLIIIGVAYFVISKRNEYQSKQLHQEKKVKELIEQYIQTNITSEKELQFDSFIAHLQKFYKKLNNYTIYPNIHNKVPFVFCEKLHEFGYLNLNELIKLKERLQITISNTSRFLNHLEEENKNS